MTCKDCFEAQEKRNQSVYFRWEEAKIEIIGCDKHLQQILKILTKELINNEKKEESNNK